MSQTQAPPPPAAVQWDFSRAHRATAVAWPDPRRRTAFWQALDLTLVLPGRTVALTLADGRAEQKDGALTLLQLRGRPQTLEAAAAELERRMVELALPRRDFDAWLAGARSGAPEKDHAFATRRNDLVPTLSLEVKHTRDAERPWYLSWEIAWPEGAEPAPPPH